MRTISIIAAIAISFMTWTNFGCGGGSDNPPNVSGLYDLTNTDCPGFFDTTVDVVQDGENVIIQATHVGFNDVSGTINNDGEFSVDNNDISCDGQFVSGVATGSCRLDDGTECQITYEK